VGVRSRGSGSLYFDTVYTFYTNTITLPGLDPVKTYFISVANVKNGVESLFCDEYSAKNLGINTRPGFDWGIRLLPNSPNPFSDRTSLVFEAGINVKLDKASFVIRDITGRPVRTIPVNVNPGLNRVEFSNPGGLKGIYTYTLCEAGNNICSGKMAIY
jgi:hypothetical protein